MNGKWALSAKDEGTLGLSDAFCPARHNQGPLLFLFFFSSLEARSPVFFLANFCGYWLWDLQAPVARGCMEPHAAAAAARSVARHANRKAAEGREFFLLWSVCFSMRRRLDGSRLARPVCHPWRHRPSWPCDRPPRALRCAASAQPDWC